MKYPLEQLVLIKQKKLEEAERILTEKKQLLAKEEEKLRAVEKERDEVKVHKVDKLTQLRELLDEGTTTDKIQAAKRYLKVVDEKLAQKQIKVKEQQKLVDAAHVALEEARADLFKKQQDVEKLNMHRKEWEKDAKKAEEYLAELESDEIGSAMHLLRKRQKSNHPKRGPSP